MRKSIHDMQVQEFMNQNKEISAIVADRIRKAVNRFEPPLDADKTSELMKMELNAVNDYINKFQIAILDKLTGFETILNDTPQESRGYDKLFHKTSNYISDLIDYNKIMAVYVDPNLPMNAKNNLATRLLADVKETIFKIRQVCHDILKQYAALPDTPATKKIIH